MADHPIPFMSPMIIAMLREIDAPGTGKTQTRRLMPHQGALKIAYSPCVSGTRILNYACEEEICRAPIRPGDRLWARETWCKDGDTDGQTALYRATEPGDVILDDGDGFAATNQDGSLRSPWRPSSNMPRWASRLTLYVTEVRVKKLNSISEADALAEGIRQDRDGAGTFIGHEGPGRWVTPWPTAREAFADFWDATNGPGAWAQNPWVSVTTFRPVLGNIDTLPMQDDLVSSWGPSHGAEAQPR